jgi:hypothetical protein
MRRILGLRGSLRPVEAGAGDVFCSVSPAGFAGSSFTYAKHATGTTLH